MPVDPQSPEFPSETKAVGSSPRPRATTAALPGTAGVAACAASPTNASLTATRTGPPDHHKPRAGRQHGVDSVVGPRAWRLNQVLAGYSQIMGSKKGAPKAERPVPATGGPGPDEASSEGQRALRLHAGIATVAVVLSVFVTWIFVRLGSIPLAVVFGVVAALSLVILGWALFRKRRGNREQ